MAPLDRSAPMLGLLTPIPKIFATRPWLAPQHLHRRLRQGSAPMPILRALIAATILLVGMPWVANADSLPERWVSTWAAPPVARIANSTTATMACAPSTPRCCTLARVAVQRRNVAEDAIVLEVIISGHHSGSWRGLPATGRQVEFPLWCRSGHKPLRV